MFEAKRLHPIAIVLNAFKILKEAFIPMIVLLFVQGGGDSAWDYFELVIPGVYLIGSLVFGTITWLRFTYRVEDDEIRINSGLIVKKKRYIRLERIQSIDVTEGILQRLFSLVKVSIETAGSSNGQAEAVLTAIPKEEALFFQSLLKEAKQGKKESDANLDEEAELEIRDVQEERVLFKMSFRQLLLMAATSGGVGVVFAGALVLYSQLGELINVGKIYGEVERLVASGIILVVIFVLFILLIAYLIATINILLKYAYFTIKKSGNDLMITRGLLERRSLTIPIGRIQAVRIVENVIRQPLGYATVFVETTSGSLENIGNANVMLFPIAKKKQLKELFVGIELDYQVDLSMTHAPDRALIRYMMRQWLWTIPLSAIMVYFFQPWGYLSILLPILFTIYAYICFKEASWNISGEQLTLTYREWLNKQSYLVKKAKVQSLTMKQSIFQKKKELGTVIAFSKTGLGTSDGTVVDLEEQDVSSIKKWFQGKQ